MLKKIFRPQKLISALILIIILFLPLTRTNADDQSDLNNQYKAKQEEIKRLQNQISQLETQEKNLSSQIIYLNGQIKLTGLKIDEAQNKLILLEKDIGALGIKIDKLNESLDKLSQLLMQRIIATYKKGNVEGVELLFSSSSFSDLLNRYKYLQVIQIHDKKLLVQMQATKDNYQDEKTTLEDKQKEIEKIKKDLEAYKKTLDQQKQAKDNLLAITRNDEKKYRQLLETARREQQQIEQAITALQLGGKSRHVSKGDIIGWMGNTGYSTGPHLHFGIYNYSGIADIKEGWYNSNYVNPANYLKSQGINWWTYPGCDENKAFLTNNQTGSGSWDWPMALDGLNITQGFGTTCFSNKLYGGKEHPALDMYNNDDLAIHATEEGNAYFYCGGQSKGNGVFIFHPNGKMSLYWHLQNKGVCN